MGADLLVRTGRHAQLAAAYDRRFASMADYCRRGGDNSGLWLAVALQRLGRAADAKTVIACTERRLAAAHAAGMQRPEHGYKLAALAALDGRRDEALRRLERAYADGFRGQMFTADPDEQPAFQTVRADRRYQAVRARLLQHVEAERRQILAVIPAPAQQTARRPPARRVGSSGTTG
jgi:hypothetical protein